MKRIILIGLLFISGFCFSQTIDSITVTIGSPTSTVYVKGIKPQMDLSNVTIVAMNDMNNTQVINLYFKGCPLNQMVLPYDTVINLTVPFPFALEVNTFHDTSANCPYPEIPLLVDTFHLYAAQILGIEELLDKEEGVNIYPNPANSLIDVFTQFEVEAVSIYSMEGKKLSDKLVGKNKFIIDLTDFAQGGYYLILKTKSNSLITKKIIIK
ncbi:T9SS type A sorting domain-containing protein [Fluviicola sp.]|jgi:hypothetical protein|uniref:T9SS type A sorting domain-containing protein n=1 Tax=Fluviicola sp. TaxID=1917219 RepID=UPI00281B5BAF|nr:T9SS type A sorting domain-containing protein [Fluviicola sp.]MDR0802873.1 T9SS type A sorting domain-containing protein [Fluviicola sp.]